MPTLPNDLRHALRLLRTPGFSAIAIFTLALGIGANTAIFSVVDAVLIRPLPYQDPERLVAITETHSRVHGEMSVSWWNFRDWRDSNQVFDSIAAIQGSGFILTGTGEAERLDGYNVSATLFSTLGIQPALGRNFLPEDDVVGASPTVILSHSLWQRRFGGDPATLGRVIQLNSRPCTIVGVLPADFRFFYESELFVPIGLNGNNMGPRGNHPGITVVARMKPGITIERARADMDAIASRLEKQYPESNAGNGIRIVGLGERFTGSMKPVLLVLVGAVGFVLVIACANVANLLLTRGAARRREVAIRMSLGAGRGRIVRQMLAESLFLALAGAACGLLLAEWGLRGLTPLIPETVRRVGVIRIDGGVLAFTLSVSILTALVFGLVPALVGTRVDLHESLKEGSRGSSGGFRRGSLRNVLVTAEIALALVLLIGAALTIRSLVRLQSVNPGFRTERLLTVPVFLPAARYPVGDKRVVFYDTLLEQVRRLPGVESVSAVNCLPLRGGCWDSIYLIEGRPIPSRENLPDADFNTAQPGYFRTMGIPLLAGRDFDERDGPASTRVVIVSQTFARENWPSEDPLGKRVKQDWPEGTGPWMTVIGIVGDAKRRGLDAAFRAEAYKASRQTDPAGLFLVVRTRVADPETLVRAVGREIHTLDADLPVWGVRTMEFYTGRATATRRFPMMLLATFAGVALVLAAVGIYGVVSYAVAQRTHEMGIRIALGAAAPDVLRLVVGYGLRLALAGVALGLAGATGLTRFLKAVLFGVEPIDLPTFIGVSVLLVTVAMLACVVPARRATRVDPIVALREE
jgi:putative ABC transport system permease protein